MSAYDAPAGAVYEIDGNIFVVLEGHRSLSHNAGLTWYRLALLLVSKVDGPPMVTYFGRHSGWDLTSTRLA